MRFVSIRQLRNNPGAVWRELGKETLVLTSNGRPIAVLVGVDEEDLEPTFETIERTRAALAVSRMRESARAAGLDRMSMTEIDREIRAARRARKGA